MNKLESILDEDGIRACLYELVKQDGGKEVAVAFSIYVAEPFYFEIKWCAWATNWMNGSDRTTNAAYCAANSAADSAANYAANYAAKYADSAANCAANSAYSAAKYADSAYYAANASNYAAYYAANSKQTETKRQTEILRKLIKEPK